MAPVAKSERSSISLATGVIVAIVGLLLLATPAAAAGSGGGLLGQLQCPCDCGKYLSVCDCSSANAGRSYVQQLRQQGYTNAEIASAYGKKFGEKFVEFVPKQGSGLSLWLTPLAAVAVGAGAVYYYFDRFRSTEATAAAPVCRECGTTLSNEPTYCPECGSRVDESW